MEEKIIIALENYIDDFAKRKQIAKDLLSLLGVSEIQNRAKKELLNAYYVAIFERDMSVEDIMQSIEADRQFLDGEIVLEEAKSILNGR